MSDRYRVDRERVEAIVERVIARAEGPDAPIYEAADVHDPLPRLRDVAREAEEIAFGIERLDGVGCITLQAFGYSRLGPGVDFESQVRDLLVESGQAEQAPELGMLELVG